MGLNPCRSRTDILTIKLVNGSTDSKKSSFTTLSIGLNRFKHCVKSYKAAFEDDSVPEESFSFDYQALCSSSPS